ncbi:PmeII family type II restriction endonuclease [Limnohabitans parvus]|uniref:Cytosolic protein n=1 Tax=Limnohabitans parvus II-B4 TaxID=1293052 RepID=A0A315FPQ4_9BURK|nr:PmeII family type II restriction endonuclease [Limnohabitans parvus]PUE55207.1 cytosolic protein [Limnohabitans parvus II-B4]
MNKLNLVDVEDFIKKSIWSRFHEKKLQKVSTITLNDVIKRKNPYLFKAKNSKSANDFISAVLSAAISSGEETTFGNFMEEIALFVCEKVYSGRKSGIKGIDLEFESNNNKYIVSIKSGPNWGNSGQIRQMLTNFRTAQKTLQTSGGHRSSNFIFIEGCCYGTDSTPNKGTHQKLCGQEFWSFISGESENLYKDLIEPFGHEAKIQNDKIIDAYNAKLNILTKDFVARFCNSDGEINWNELVEFNSGRKLPRINAE